MISILISILVLAVIAYAVYVVINFIPVPEPIKTIVWLIFGLIVLIKLLALVGYNIG